MPQEGNKIVSHLILQFILYTGLKEVGSQLYVAIGDPIDVLSSVLDNMKQVKKVTYERDPDPLQTVINTSVENLCRRRGKEVIRNILFHPKSKIGPCNFADFWAC